MSAPTGNGAGGASATAGDWDGLVVICGTTPWDGARLVDQHLASHLTDYAPVLYVDPPVPRWAARDDVVVGPELVGPRLARLRPVVNAGHQRPLGKKLSVTLTRRALKRAIRALGSPRVKAVIVSSLNPLFDVCDEDVRVFYSKDDYVAGAELMRISPWRLRRREVRQPADADLIVAASPVLAEKWTRMGYHPMLLPNGCDAEGLAAVGRLKLPDDVRLRPPIAGFVGHLSERVDFDLLHGVLDAGLSLLLVGRRPPAYVGAQCEALLGRPRTQWVGFRPYDRIPAYLGLLDVGLVPYRPTPFNAASFPLKMLEYLAAGRPVVSTDLPAVRWLDTDLITIASTPEAFGVAAREATRTAHDRRLVEARRRFAARHSWRSRVAELAQALGLEPIDLREPAAVHAPQREVRS